MQIYICSESDIPVVEKSDLEHLRPGQSSLFYSPHLDLELELLKAMPVYMGAPDAYITLLKKSTQQSSLNTLLQLDLKYILP